MVQSKKLVSGEIFKEPMLDVFLTDFEQSSFSLLCQPPHQFLNTDIRESELKDGLLPLALGGSDTLANQDRVGDRSKRDQTSPTYSPQSSQFDETSVSKTDGFVEPIPTTIGQETFKESRRRSINDSFRNLKSFSNFGKALDLESDSGDQKHRMTVNVKIGDYVHSGDKIGEFFGTPIIIGDSGKVITLTKNQLTLQKTQPVLFYSEATIHVEQNEWVQRGSPILTLTHQTLVTGDIVQGIPRIEQLFEAVTSSPSASVDDKPLHETLHSKAREIFRRDWSKMPLPTAVRHALEEIQQIIVESIQKVYLSQGVLIADKHIEIIVKQMTSKGQILDNGNTGFLIDEIVPLRKIENANLTTAGKKAIYAPAVVGLTNSALSSDSFVSAASFQETTRVLTRDAIAGKSDFLRGLKEKVVIGDLIAAGTGLDIFFLYTLLAEKIFDPTCRTITGAKSRRRKRNTVFDAAKRRLLLAKMRDSLKKRKSAA